jgi:hypothetical protein
MGTNSTAAVTSAVLVGGMMKIPRNLVAEERAGHISRAIADWKWVSAKDGEAIGWSENVFCWNNVHGYWAKFGGSPANTDSGWRYWNAFGIKPEEFRSNILVEINPPQSGIAKGTQGLIAHDVDGRRWILHGGRVHVGKIRVDSATFGKLSGLRTVEVAFSDASTRSYFVVAPLDQGPEALHASLFRFIERCSYVRNTVLHGVAEADLDRRVEAGEVYSSPETGGSFLIPPRGAAEGQRSHGDIWKALAAELDRRRIEHSNTRVGRYGPDLRTRKAPMVLFEIKTDVTAKSVYEALGQLLIYERLLGTDYAKALVVPDEPPRQLMNILRGFEISIVLFSKIRRSYDFEAVSLNRLLKPMRARGR